MHIQILTIILLFCSCDKQEISTKSQIDYQISINDTLEIELESNWSTGYSWYWENKNEISFIDTLKREYIEDNSRRGAIGIEKWSFVGINNGFDTVTLLYKRSIYDAGCDNRKDFVIKVE
jgi:predicted secreted protein